MTRRIFSTTVILAIIVASLFYASGARQPALVNIAQAAETSLSSEAGMSAYTNIGAVDLEVVKPAFQAIEYQTTELVVGTLDLPLYEATYDPLVLVTGAGDIVAFYPSSDPAGKLTDVISKNLNTTLLEQAVNLVAGAAGVVPTPISHFDFSHPDATTMLLVAEHEPDGNAFSLQLGADNTYYEKSYAFYRTFSPSFTLDNETTEQVNFVLENADYLGAGYYGTIYGRFGVIDFNPGSEYTFAVAAGDHLGFGALAILYSGDALNTIADADFSKVISLTNPGIDPVFDLTPSVLSKALPVDGSTDVVLNPNLSWAESTAPNYEYCIDTNPDNACEDDAWISTGSDTSVALSNLFYETTYYWQVRATNSYEVIEADEGTWSSFTTADGIAPLSFVKVDTILSQPIDSLSRVTMTWEPSYGAYYYEVCVDTESACTAPEFWHNVGLATSATIGDLLLNSTYFWQVRAVNDFGTTYAGDWVEFTTRTFSKLRPVDNEVYNLTLPFKWEETPIATNGYEYCIDNSAPDADPDTDDCNTEWKRVSGTSVVVNFKKNDMLAGIYYWQVRTFGSELEANDGDWWMFEVLSKKDLRKINLFKVSPEDGAVNLLASGLDLTWNSTLKTNTSYEYCYFDIDDTDTTPIADDDTCTYNDDNWAQVGATSATISGLDNATTYYWQVRANLGTADDPVWIYADKGDYWAFTTEP